MPTVAATYSQEVNDVVFALLIRHTPCIAEGEALVNQGDFHSALAVVNGEHIVEVAVNRGPDHVVEDDELRQVVLVVLEEVCKERRAAVTRLISDVEFATIAAKWNSSRVKMKVPNSPVLTSDSP